MYPLPLSLLSTTRVRLLFLFDAGRDKPILEMDLKLDDLLEKQQMGVQYLDLEYVKLSVAKLVTLLKKSFYKK